MKYMILTYASQQDYDGMAGKPTDRPAWSAEDFAAMGEFMESFNKDLADSGELVECDSFDRATEIAGRLANCPAPPEVAATAVADVRPLADSRTDLEL